MEPILNSAMCRCCASEGTFKDIHTKYHWMGDEEVYSVMLKECFDITLSSPQGDQSGICEVCITQLRNAFNFKKQVLHTEEQFQHMLGNKVQDIKLEYTKDSSEEPEDRPVSEADNSDPDFTPSIKEEEDEPESKPKAKKRAAKSTATRAKKPKLEAPETSTQSHAGARKKHRTPSVMAGHDETSNSIAFRQKHMPEMKKQWHNLMTLLEYSNATPFKDRNDAGYICAYCFKTFPDPQVLRGHTSTDHLKEKPNYKAGTGMASFVAFLDIVDLKCTICNYPMENLKTLAQHLVERHGKMYYSDVTDYFQPFKLTNDQQIKCCLCSDAYHNMKLLMQHMNVHYRNFICTTCGAGFVNSFRLNRHELTHAKKKSDFPCRFCGQVFAVESKRKAHVNTEHKGIAGDSVCQICKARFKNYYQKTRHMIQEHNMEGIKCDMCERKFNLKSNLMLHMRSVHLKERPYECSVCSMGFFIKRHMVGHYLATHTNERKFKCEICGKAYATQNSKRKHMRKNHGVTKNAVTVQHVDDAT